RRGPPPPRTSCCAGTPRDSRPGTRRVRRSPAVRPTVPRPPRRPADRGRWCRRRIGPRCRSGHPSQAEQSSRSANIADLPKASSRPTQHHRPGTPGDVRLTRRLGAADSSRPVIYSEPGGDVSEQDDRHAWTRSGAFEVAPGVWRIPAVLPMDGLRAVNIYALADGGGLTLIDGGWALDEA